MRTLGRLLSEMGCFLMAFLCLGFIILWAVFNIERHKKYSIKEFEGKLATIQNQLQDTETLLVKRITERNKAKSEFNLLVRRSNKNTKEIKAELAKNNSEIASELWFHGIKDAWDNLKDLERDVVIFTRQEKCLNTSKNQLEQILEKLRRREENERVYISGEDPELDRLIAEGDVLAREETWDNLFSSEKTAIGIEVDRIMDEMIDNNVLAIPGLKMKAVKSLCPLPSISSYVQEPYVPAERSLLVRLTKDCNKILEQSNLEFAGCLEKKQLESACYCRIEAVHLIQENVINASDNFQKDFFQNFLNALAEYNNDVLLVLSKPYLQALSQCVKNLESEDPDWETIADSLEGIHHIDAKLPAEEVRSFENQLETIRGHLDYLLKQNDLDAKVKSQRVKAIIGEIDGTFQHKARDRKVFIVDDIEYAFRWCPPGEFLMGSTPGHKVKLTQGFWLLETEVTQEMWKSIIGSNPSGFQSWFRRTRRNPVENVSWNDCQEFCRKLSEKLGQMVTLPTEAQWEYACCAGRIGDDVGDLDSLAWFGNYQDFFYTTHPVGQKKPNAWGLYDMLGNVREWTSDSSHGYNQSTEVETSCCVSRGGSWSDKAEICRPAYRNWDDPDVRFNNTGLRILLVPN